MYFGGLGTYGTEFEGYALLEKTDIHLVCLALEKKQLINCYKLNVVSLHILVSERCLLLFFFF